MLPVSRAMRRDPMQHARIIERIRAEYLEMPGLRLTPAQAQRLCGIDGTICQAVLDALVDARFLAVNAHGMYARITDGAWSRPHPAKVAHPPTRSAKLAS